MTLTAATERTEQKYDTGWRDFAACRGVLSQDVWCTDETNAWIDDVDLEVVRTQEAECLAICRGCQVRPECALAALTDDNYVEHTGVVAGTTAPQRVWLRTNSGIAMQVALECAEDGVSTDDLSDWYTAVGPDDLPEVPETPAVIRRRRGVHESTYRQWRTERGMAGGTSGARSEKQHLGAYGIVLVVLSDGEWHLRSELVAALHGSPQIDKSMIENTKTFEKKGAKAAWHAIVEGVVQSGMRDGTIERRAAEGSQNPSKMRLAPVG